MRCPCCRLSHAPNWQPDQPPESWCAIGDTGDDDAIAGIKAELDRLQKRQERHVRERKRAFAKMGTGGGEAEGTSAWARATKVRAQLPSIVRETRPRIALHRPPLPHIAHASSAPHTP